jgi:hypothetical protein
MMGHTDLPAAIVGQNDAWLRWGRGWLAWCGPDAESRARAFCKERGVCFPADVCRR